jgi:4,4'-diaponeurosporenoate glycosyltransferase
MVAIVLYSLVVLGWLAGFFFLFFIPTCKTGTHPSGVLPSISIIIPARNEEANLPRLLASIAAQPFQPTEVIVVDDQSVDQTPAIAREYQATVLASKPLPEGWVGKAWACYQGACQASGDLLIFLDADTYLAQDGLQKILDTYVNEPAVMSIAPYHETEKFHEQFSAFFNIIMTGSMNAFTMLGNALKPTGLFGPSLIVSRDQYFSIQGHAAVKDKILEHFFMAQIFITHQIPLKCLGGKGTLSFRMYPQSFHELIQGWSKAFAKGAGQTKALPLGLIIVWLSGAISVVINLSLGGFIFGAAFVWSNLVLYIAYSGQIYWMLSRIGNFRWYTSLGYPGPLLFFFMVFLNSVFSMVLHKKVQWKDRNIGN